MTLAEAPMQSLVVVEEIGGEQGFRRRLMELGLLPGTEVRLVRSAPFGDPLELQVRGSRLSIRRAEARAIAVRPAHAAARDAAPLPPAAPATSLS